MVDSGIFSKLPSKLLSNDGEVSTSDVLSSSLIGVYFSAHWCPPCRGFTPVLADCFTEWKNESKSIQIIFVSSDRDEDEFKNYFKEMPWVAVPFNDKNTIKEFKTHFNVTGIPKFVVLDNKGNIIDSDARTSVSKNNVVSIDAWSKK